MFSNTLALSVAPVKPEFAAVPVRSGDFLAGWRACCNCGQLDIETDSKEFQRGFVAAWRAGELEDPHSLNEFLDAIRAGQVEPVRLTEEQMEELEEERIGASICEHPYDW